MNEVAFKTSHSKHTQFPTNTYSMLQVKQTDGAQYATSQTDR